MGATVWLTPQFVGARAIELVTDESGLFVTQRLRPGFYSVKVTLAGFMPSFQSNVSVAPNGNTSIHIELYSILASLDELRQKSSKAAEPDDWKWILRTASSSRPILQLRDGTVVVATRSQSETDDQPRRMSVELDNGSVRPGSSSALPGYVGTSASYDQRLGSAGTLLMAGEVDYDQAISGLFGGSAASIWLPSGRFGEGPETTFVVRQYRLGNSDRSIRSMRFEHSEQMAIAQGVVAEYGAEYLSGGLVGALSSSLRPHARLGFRLPRHWDAAFLVESDPDAYALRTQIPDQQPAIEALQTAPILVWDNGRPVLNPGWHEEFQVQREVGSRGKVEGAVFRDDSRHEAVYGSTAAHADSYYAARGIFPGPIAYDGGGAGFWGTRLVYREKLADNLEVAGVYAWAGALPPTDQSAPFAVLHDALEIRYRHSIAGRVAGKIPKSKTQVSASYKWIDGTVVTRQDLYSETAMGVDPNISLSIRQPLPAFTMGSHWEALADFRNILSQGYVSLEGPDGRILMTPVERSFRGGISFQF